MRIEVLDKFEDGAARKVWIPRGLVNLSVDWWCNMKKSIIFFLFVGFIMISARLSLAECTDLGGFDRFVLERGNRGRSSCPGLLSRVRKKPGSEKRQELLDYEVISRRPVVQKVKESIS
jgi:hypothetical protein